MALQGEAWLAAVLRTSSGTARTLVSGAMFVLEAGGSALSSPEKRRRVH